ncbi:MAG TPA: ABC transporter ATP-binding protein [Vicinamibacteria bacterium]|nr:ABC transporter ATP-binding protein [Vicinamibacteria bacterium]
MASDTTDSPLQIVGLSKAYRVGFLARQRRTALDSLSLALVRGELLGYLGPNGSGKTTTLKILTGLIFPDSGSVSVLGEPLGSRGWRRRVGYLPEHPYLYDYLTPNEYLDYAGRLFGLETGTRRASARALLAQVGLEDSADVVMRRFSKGMVQRVGLAQALLNDPELVLLDEPMSGLDPLGRRLVRNIVLDLKARGKTVLFSTHILSDAETLCDRVAVLRSGKLLAVGRLDQILNVDVSALEVLVSVPGASLPDLPGGVRVHPAMSERVRLDVPEGALAPVVAAVEGAGGRVLSVLPTRESLEDYFVREMGPPAEGTWAPRD